MKRSSKKYILLCGFLLALALGCIITQAVLGGRLVSQKEAERWKGDSPMEFVQLSAYLEATEGMTLENIYEFRQTMLKKIDEAALEQPAAGTLYTDAWSAQGKLKVGSEKTLADVDVIAVGGNFFAFHPIRLLSGSYLNETDVMNDRVLLDEELAWKLFGGFDLAGMTVEINGKPFVIAGVIHREDDTASKKAYTGAAGMFMSYDALNAISETKIDCYEVVLPEPVDNFAQNLMKDNFKLGSGVLVTNTGRFGVLQSLKGLRDFGSRSMHASAVAYPYWENAARYYEDWCTLLTGLSILFLILPVVLVCTVLVRLLLAGRRKAKAVIPVAAARAAERVSIRFSSRGGKHMKRKG